MQTPRRARFLARLVLAWFVLALGVAVAAPLVQPPAMELVCSVAGNVKLVQLVDASGDQGTSTHKLECPLCLTGAATPPVTRAPLAVQPLPAHCPVAEADARFVSRVAAALPARGPPVRA